MERAVESRTIDLAEVRRLMARATGDEKHDESSTSTLDAVRGDVFRRWSWEISGRPLLFGVGEPG